MLLSILVAALWSGPFALASPAVTLQGPIPAESRIGGLEGML